MTGGREPRATEDSTRDEYPPDTGFGRAPTADQEVVDALAEEGEGESPLREGSRPVPPPAGKAEVDGDGDEEPDEASRQSFPASDPPSSTGSTA